MSDRWAVSMVEAIRGKKDDSGSSCNFMFGTVNTAKPLTIKMHNQIISKNLYINPALLVDADDALDKIEQNFIGAPSPPALFNFLKSFHQKCIIQKDDEVIVMQAGISFYIVAKVVAAI